MRQLPESILLLIRKYLNGTSTPEDKSRLNEWYRSFDDSEVELTENETETEIELSDKIRTRILESIHHGGNVEVTKTRRRWPAAAAVIVILLSFGAYFMFLRNSSEQEIVRTASSSNETKLKNDIKPGGNKAMLTLADGSVVVLDSASNGIVSRQGNIKVQKLSNGLLAYTINGKTLTQNDKSFFNTISTPRGGEYQVTLSDGTKVWLNAASSIRFPVVFTGSERKVEITGEAYFEVTKNKAMPFRVKVESMTINVLGTHFNVNAYEDENSVTTTLLEGSVRIEKEIKANGSAQSLLLKPGDQAELIDDGRLNINHHADLQQVIAWKEGNFEFKNTTVKEIMRQISRWYDVEVEYKGARPEHKLTGKISRNVNLSELIDMLQYAGVNMKIQNKKVIIW